MPSIKARVKKLNKLLAKLSSMKDLPYEIKEAVIIMRDQAEEQSKRYTYEDVFMADYSHVRR